MNQMNIDEHRGGCMGSKIIFLAENAENRPIRKKNFFSRGIFRRIGFIEVHLVHFK